VGPGLPARFRGLYELFAVVTHKGRSADSGHYMGWVRNSGGACRVPCAALLLFVSCPPLSLLVCAVS
jgi:hypothetical protein